MMMKFLKEANLEEKVKIKQLKRSVNKDKRKLVLLEMIFKMINLIIKIKNLNINRKIKKY